MMKIKRALKGKKMPTQAIGIIIVFYIVFSLLQPLIFPLTTIYASNSKDAVANMQINAGGDGAVTGEVIDNWIQNDSLRKGSRLDGRGDEIVKVADKYGVNRAFFVALMDAETSMGVNSCFSNDYNFGCIRGYSGTSIEQGLDDLGQLLVKYISGSISVEMPENPTIQEFTNVYAPAFENDHDSRFKNHGAVFGFLGVDADEMQGSGELKNGGEATSPDYDTESNQSSLAANCPINCDLVDEQRVNDNNNGTNTGNLHILTEGLLWKNEDSLTKTDLGYTSDQTTRDTLEEFLNSLTSDEEMSKEYASYFYEAGQVAGLDPRFLVSFWSVNTKNGKEEAWEKAYNAFGWSTGETFANEKEGIIEGAKLISVNYYNEGQTTLSKMVEDDSGHIVSADEDWSKSVAAIMQKSEKYITKSTGKVADDAEVVDKSEWVYEQCYGNGDSGMNITGGNYTKQVINVLRDEGLTDESIAGILGNMQQESGINPTRIQGHSVKESEDMSDEERDLALKNHTKGAYAGGIVQWEAPRFRAVRSKASELGVSPYTIEPQMYVLVKELKSTKSGSYGSGSLYDLYKTNTDIYTSTASFAEKFERCAACKVGTGEFEKRNAMSKELFSTYF